MPVHQTASWGLDIRGGAGLAGGSLQAEQAVCLSRCFGQTVFTC